jgi:hypothetical protein
MRLLCCSARLKVGDRAAGLSGVACKTGCTVEGKMRDV